MEVNLHQRFQFTLFLKSKLQLAQQDNKKMEQEQSD